MLLGRPFAGLSCEVFDGTGTPHTLAAVIGSRPAVVVFLRHFGCVGCELQVTALLPREPELSDLGVAIALVGSGSVDDLRAFIDRHDLGGRHVRVMTDPSLATFRAAGFLRSAWATYGPRSLTSELLAIGNGFRPRRVKGDPLQQGGALVLDGSGAVVFSHVSRFIGDAVEASDLVDATLRLRLRSVDADGLARTGVL